MTPSPYVGCICDYVIFFVISNGNGNMHPISVNNKIMSVMFIGDAFHWYI